MSKSIVWLMRSMIALGICCGLFCNGIFRVCSKGESSKFTTGRFPSIQFGRTSAGTYSANRNAMWACDRVDCRGSHLGRDVKNESIINAKRGWLGLIAELK